MKTGSIHDDVIANRRRMDLDGPKRQYVPLCHGGKAGRRKGAGEPGKLETVLV
jgi:hypothetical protein